MDTITNKETRIKSDTELSNLTDFTRFFAHLREDFDAGFDWGALKNGEDWVQDWQTRLQAEDPESSLNWRRAQSPIYIPRNHQVARAIEAANAGDDTVMFKLLAVLQDPYTVQEGKEDYTQAPKADEVVTRTFCGT